MSSKKDVTETSNNAIGSPFPVELQTCLFQSIIKYRPIGINLHFSLINVQIYIRKSMGITLTCQQIEEFYQQYYDLDAEILEKEDFNLPFEEFDELIDLRRRVDSDTEVATEPVNRPKRARTAKAVKKKKK
jgi:hypothetical protein